MIGSAHVLAARAQHEYIDLRHIAMTFRKLLTVRDLALLLRVADSVLRDRTAGLVLVDDTCRMRLPKLADVFEKTAMPCRESARRARTLRRAVIGFDGSRDFGSQLGDSGNPLHLLGIAFTAEDMLKTDI